MKKRSIIIAIIAFVLVVGAVAGVWLAFGPGTSEGEKEITIEVIDNKGEAKKYELNTDALYLNEAMKEAGILYEAEGTYVNSINGITADYDKDQSYWSFEVNGEYCNLGIFDQPVNDGDSFTIAYTIYEG